MYGDIPVEAVESSSGYSKFNMNPEEVARERRYSFALIGIPLKFNGATGSPLRPLALV